jgi:hypothetical protein
MCSAHGLTFTLEDLNRFSSQDSGSANDCRPFFRPNLPWDLPPLQRSKLGESTSRSDLRGSAYAIPFLSCLVAGFHARFGPSSSFLTILTVCSSSSSVECFVHSRSWGSFSLLPVRLSFCWGPKTFARRHGDGSGSEGSRLGGDWVWLLEIELPKYPDSNSSPLFVPSVAPVSEVTGPTPALLISSPRQPSKSESVTGSIARTIVWCFIGLKYPGLPLVTTVTASHHSPIGLAPL